MGKINEYKYAMVFSLNIILLASLVMVYPMQQAGAVTKEPLGEAIVRGEPLEPPPPTDVIPSDPNRGGGSLPPPGDGSGGGGGTGSGLKEAKPRPSVPKGDAGLGS